MKTSIFVAGVLAIAVITTVYFINREHATEPIACTMEARQCPDGSYVGREGPDCSFAPCPQANAEQPADDRIRITSPQPGNSLTSPITVSGIARGNWFFEASAPVLVVDWDGRIIGEGFITAQGDWMTTEFVPFTGTITYTVDPLTPYNRGAIIFKKDNPSGLPEYDDAREIPITFSELTSGNVPTPTPDDGTVFCTMDAKQCPDGSYVGRIPPSCGFAPCPGPSIQ